MTELTQNKYYKQLSADKYFDIVKFKRETGEISQISISSFSTFVLQTLQKDLIDSLFKQKKVRIISFE